MHFWMAEQPRLGEIVLYEEEKNLETQDEIKFAMKSIKMRQESRSNQT